jgi:3-hydroxymyristoyl/3-hydroxydecanoyl-(acyl carrier protein) dehydratase
MVISQEEIKKKIPHRFENILLDSAEILGTPECPQGTLTLQLSDTDVLGRHIFLSHKYPNQTVLCTPVMMEVLALGAVVACGHVPDDSFLFYAGIRDFRVHGDFLSGQRITGKVSQKSQKATFYQYKGALFSEEGACIAEGDMTAVIVKKEDFSKKHIDESSLPLPEMSVSLPIAKNADFKSLDMFVSDTIVNIAADFSSICCSYTFPLHHPLVRGHFPGLPVMMGVMQMMGVEDAVFAFIHQILEKTPHRGVIDVACDGVIYDGLGHTVSELKGCLIRTFIAVDAIRDHSEMVGVSKVSFKKSVKPGDTIYFLLSDIRLIFG